MDGDLLSKLVLNARNEITSTDSSMTTEFKYLYEISELLPGRGDAKQCEQFMDSHYSGFLSFLLSNFDPSHLDASTKGKTFESLIRELIMCGPSEQAFLVVCQSLKNVRHQSLRFHKIVIWVNDLMESDCVSKALLKRCRECYSGTSLLSTDESFREFIQVICSLPDTILFQNKDSLATDLFYPDKYSCHISKQIIETLTFCHRRLASGLDTTVIPISKLLGKMCVSGYGQNMWKCIMDSISTQLSKIWLWRRLMQKVILNVDDWCLDCVVEPLILQINFPLKISDFLGDIPLRNLKLENILIHKFILSRYFTDSRIPKNILKYLASDVNLKKLFDKLFISVLKVWCQKDLLKYQPFEQTYYLCQVILIGLKILKSDMVIPDDVKEEMNKTVLNGLASYLDSSVHEIRQMGMIVAQNLSSLAVPVDIKLELPIEDDHFTKKLLKLLESDDFEKEMDLNENLCGEPDESNAESQVNKELLDSDDDDDDLLPLPAVQRKSGPTYFVQCIEGLTNYEDHKFMEECLKACCLLIEKHSGLDGLDIELCRRLLYLEDRFSFDNFHKLRFDALVELVVKSPEAIAHFLTQEFYERNYNQRQRMEILDILVKGAQNLSTSNSSKERKDEEEHIKTYCPDNIKDWQKVVQERINSKTRRFAKDRSKVQMKEFKNRFSTCAGWFFYPLLKNVETKEHVDMCGCDHLLLEKFLHALSSIVYCSINIPSSSSMAKTLLQFSTRFRLHAEMGIRRAVLHAVFISIVVLDASQSLHEMSQDMCDLHSWLVVTNSRDPDSQCSQFAEQILSLLNALRIKLLQ